MSGLWPPPGPQTLDEIFILLQADNLEMHGLFEERNPQHPADTYGSAPWNCRLVYRFRGSHDKFWPMYCYGAGSTAAEAILSAVDDARRLRSTPWTSPKPAAQQLSLEDIGL